MTPDDGIAAANELIVAALVQRGGVAPDVARESLVILARQAAAGDAEAARALRECQAGALNREADFLDTYFRIMGTPKP